MPGFIWSGIRIDRTKQIHKKGRCEKPVPKINMKPFTKKIVLENGREFYGYGFGADREVINEIVFNTSMVGYQEIMSDPSYTDQMVVMTYPLIGNYGMADEDYETKTPTIGGMIVREYVLPHDMVSRVSCKKRWMSRVPNHKYDVVAVDCGIKYNIIRQLNRVGCNVTVVPFDSTLEEIMAFRPDGVVLSNGPGNPQDVTPVIELVRQLRGKLPIFGICMGHQLISLAYGAKTVKMKFGHRGGNHPVKNLSTGKIEITSQNHSYAVDVDSLAGTGLELTHVNLLDGTAEGVECVGDAVFSMQYHPESASGPQDSGYLFRKFTKIMEERKNA